MLHNRVEKLIEHSRNPISRIVPFISAEEKEELIVRFLKQESARMGQELYISRRAMNVLLHHTYGGNIGELIAVPYIPKKDDGPRQKIGCFPPPLP